MSKSITPNTIVALNSPRSGFCKNTIFTVIEKRKEFCFCWQGVFYDIEGLQNKPQRYVFKSKWLDVVEDDEELAKLLGNN